MIDDIIEDVDRAIGPFDAQGFVLIKTVGVKHGDSDEVARIVPIGPGAHAAVFAPFTGQGHKIAASYFLTEEELDGPSRPADFARAVVARTGDHIGGVTVIQ